MAPNCLAIRAVRAYAVLFMIPMPSLLGQTSALISFICHFWWPPRSVGPCASTVLTQSFPWSRHQIQPLNDAARNFLADPRVLLAVNHLRLGEDASSSIPVPMLSILITF